MQVIRPKYTDLDHMLREHWPEFVVFSTDTHLTTSVNCGERIHVPTHIPLVAKRGMISNFTAAARNNGLPPPVRMINEDPSTWWRHYRGQPLDGKTVAAWMIGGFGDLCFFQPIIREIKERWPSCKVKCLSFPSCEMFLRTWDLFDSFCTIPSSLRYLEDAEYHLAFDDCIVHCLEAEKVNAYRLAAKWFNLDIDDEDLRPQLTPRQDDVDDVLRYLNEQGVEAGKYIYVQFRASAFIRTPSPRAWQEILIPLLCDGYHMVVADMMPAAKVVDNYIEKFFPEDLRKNIHNFTARSRNFNKVVAAISQSSIAIHPDSSTGHVAQGLGIPSLGIYGGFNPELRMGTYKNCEWVQPNSGSDICEYGGRHCHLHTFDVAYLERPWEHCKCYDKLDFEEVYEKAVKLLTARGNTNGPRTN